MITYWAIVPAGGSGRRMQMSRPKQYLTLHGRTIIEHTLSRLMQVSRITGIVVAIASDDVLWSECLTGLQKRWPKPWLQRLHVVQAGRERAYSVLNALTYLNKQVPADTRVLVHDAVRPCVRLSDIDGLIEQAGGHQEGGLLAMPVADTLKKTVDGRSVDHTVSREGLWRACTPQLFALGCLHRALEDALAQGLPVTDEASAMEAAGYRPKLIACHADNIKLTHPQDLGLIECLLPYTEETPCA